MQVWFVIGAELSKSDINRNSRLNSRWNRRNLKSRRQRNLCQPYPLRSWKQGLKLKSSPIHMRMKAQEQGSYSTRSAKPATTTTSRCALSRIVIANHRLRGSMKRLACRACQVLKGLTRSQTLTMLSFHAQSTIVRGCREAGRSAKKSITRSHKQERYRILLLAFIKICSLGLSVTR